MNETIVKACEATAICIATSLIELITLGEGIITGSYVVGKTSPERVVEVRELQRLISSQVLKYLNENLFGSAPEEDCIGVNDDFLDAIVVNRMQVQGVYYYTVTVVTAKMLRSIEKDVIFKGVSGGLSSLRSLHVGVKGHNDHGVRVEYVELNVSSLIRFADLMESGILQIRLLQIFNRHGWYFTTMETHPTRKPELTRVIFKCGKVSGPVMQGLQPTLMQNSYSDPLQNP